MNQEQAQLPTCRRLPVSAHLCMALHVYSANIHTELLQTCSVCSAMCIPPDPPRAEPILSLAQTCSVRPSTLPALGAAPRWQLAHVLWSTRKVAGQPTTAVLYIHEVSSLRDQ